MSEKLQTKIKEIWPQVIELFRFKYNPEAFTKFLLIVEGLFFSSISLLGTMIGYMRSYNRFMKPEGRGPDLYRLPVIVKISMILGAVAIWAALYGP